MLFPVQGYDTTLYGPHLASTLKLNKVVITPNLNNSRLFLITWQPQTSAVCYKIYVSPVPINRNLYQEVAKDQTSIEFEVPIVLPDNVIWYTNVSRITPSGNEVFINEYPIHTAVNTAFDMNPLSTGTKRDLIDGLDRKYFCEEIRRRHAAILENDGEDYYLYIRRMFGQPCVCLDQTTGGTGGRTVPQATGFIGELGEEFDPSVSDEHEQDQAKDPGYQSTHRCQYCFGTQLAGGYYPKLSLKVRYGRMPVRILKMQESGIEFSHDFNSHTLWHPTLKERDVLVKVRTGERFVVKSPSQSEWQGIALHQEFNAIAEGRNSPIYSITDTGIEDALKAEGAFNISKFDWGVWS